MTLDTSTVPLIGYILGYATISAALILILFGGKKDEEERPSKRGARSFMHEEPPFASAAPKEAPAAPAKNRKNERQNIQKEKVMQLPLELREARQRHEEHAEPQLVEEEHAQEHEYFEERVHGNEHGHEHVEKHAPAHHEYEDEHAQPMDLVHPLEEPAPPSANYSLAEDIIGSPVQLVSPDKLNGEWGRVVCDVTGLPTQIQLSNELTPDELEMGLAQKLGYAINLIVGKKPLVGAKGSRTGIPIDDIEDELRIIYSAGVTGEDRADNLVGPEDYGFSGDEVARQLMAEAFRTYLTNPDFMKKVAPNAARRIRTYSNPTSRVSAIIYFN